VFRNPEFEQAYARARLEQAHVLAERAVMVAEDARPEDVAVARLRFDAQRWFAGRLDPKNYADRTKLEHSGAEGGPIKLEGGEADTRIRQLLKKGGMATRPND
jgi:hypothetical protein